MNERLDLYLNGIPEELKRHRNWVNWTIEDREGKPTKIPINPRTGGKAQSNNPSTWASFDEAVRRWKECENVGIEGIGFVLSDGYSGADLDHCRDINTGEVQPWAKEIIAELRSYTEITPSDEGIRVLTKGKLPKGRRVKGGLPSSDGGENGKIEMYDSGRFFTITGRHLGGTPSEIHQREEELRKIHSVYMANDQKPPLASNNDSTSFSDSNLIQKAKQALNGEKFTTLMAGDWSDYPSQSEADLALCMVLAFWTGRDPGRIDALFRQSGLMRQKWDERHSSDGKTYGALTITKAIEQTTEGYSESNKNQIEKKNASSSEENKKTYEIGINLTDLGNARRFVAAHGRDLRYCYPWGKWLFWDSRRWVTDDVGGVNRRAKATVGLIYKEAAEEKDNDRRKALSSHALRCESDGKLKAMVELAKSEPGIPIKPEEMDRDPWLLNVLNGTINLLSGDLQPHQRENYITKMAPVEFQPGAQCLYWLEHLNKIMADNQNLISFLQRAYGYSLTGVTDERIAFIEHGTGANGKTTTNEVISMIMGDYSVRTPTETLLVKREGAIPNDVAKLKGARFVYCSEAEEGKRLAESLLKDLTGGDTIPARFMRGEWFEFKPSFKLWLATNHKPVIRGTDSAVWDRIRLVPFTVSIPESERIPRREMVARFEEELPAILAWMVQGCLEWQRMGLGMPKEVKEATGQYREEMDLIGEFISECCVVSKGEEASSSKLYEKYCKWCENNGERPISQKALGKRLRERGFSDGRTGKVRYWRGIGLENDA